MNSHGVSVIVCCYNSIKRLPNTIKHLALQEFKNEIPWEIIIIDNNSNDDTGLFALEEWEKYNSSVPFCVCQEPKAGLSHARKLGISLSKYEFILFCDDDNFLNSDYVATAFQIMINNSYIGMLGGIGLPIVKGYTQKWLDLTIFATGPQAPTEGDITNLKGYVYGAGCVIRKECFRIFENLKLEFLLSDRIGKELSSGGDVELGLHIRLIGYNIYYSDRLIFKHLIDDNRLEWNYVRRLYYSFGYCSSLYTIPSLFYHYRDSKKKDIKLSWYWLLANGILMVLRKNTRKIFLGIFFKNYKYHYAVFLQDLGYCFGVFKNRKIIKNKYNELLDRNLFVV